MKPTGPVEFGVSGNVPLQNGKPDTTELDMRVGNIVCEAKLTESDFTSQRATVVEAYRDLHAVFDGNLLFPPESVTTKNGEPYKVFTPFYKTCLKKLPPPEPLSQIVQSEQCQQAPYQLFV